MTGPLPHQKICLTWLHFKTDNHKPRRDEGLIHLLCIFLHFRSDEMPLHGCKIRSLSLSLKTENIQRIKVIVKLSLGLI